MWLLRPSVSQTPDNNSDFTQQDGRKKRTAKHSCATNLIGLLLVFCRDLHLTPTFTRSLQNDLFKGKWSLAKSCFKQNYCHACRTRLAIFPLPSCCVSSLIGNLRTTTMVLSTTTGSEIQCTAQTRPVNFVVSGVVDNAKQSRIMSSFNPQALAGINPPFLRDFWSSLHFFVFVNSGIFPFFS